MLAIPRTTIITFYHIKNSIHSLYILVKQCYLNALLIFDIDITGVLERSIYWYNAVLYTSGITYQNILHIKE